jgi:hypothetical protein
VPSRWSGIDAPPVERHCVKQRRLPSKMTV